MGEFVIKIKKKKKSFIKLMYRNSSFNNHSQVISLDLMWIRDFSFRNNFNNKILQFVLCLNSLTLDIIILSNNVIIERNHKKEGNTFNLDRL